MPGVRAAKQTAEVRAVQVRRAAIVHRADRDVGVAADVVVEVHARAALLLARELADRALVVRVLRRWRRSERRRSRPVASTECSATTPGDDICAIVL